MKYCCDKFSEDAGALRPVVGGGGLYPREIRPKSQFLRSEDGTWEILGCCGGGCSVVSDMKFCPYCGASVTSADAPPK